MMRHKIFLPITLAIILAFAAVSCLREPDFVQGQYRYENEELSFLNGLVEQWGEEDLPEEIKETVREIIASMVLVEGGTFTMGSDSSGAFPDEMPAHTVTLSDFYLGKVTVTQKQWSVIMGENDYWTDLYGKGDDYPANFISFGQALLFIERLIAYSGLQFRLPTEAEWEFAACGGRHSRGYLYSGSNFMDRVAWCRENAAGTMHPVALLAPNELGIYDMSGNVWEWCSDWYGNYSPTSATNPTGPLTGIKRVVRGGSFTYDAEYARCKARNCLSEANQSLSVGIRLAVSAGGSH